MEVILFPNVKYLEERVMKLSDIGPLTPKALDRLINYHVTLISVMYRSIFSVPQMQLIVD
jgi:hypothetical protein